MRVYYWLVLIGLVVEIIACFILSLEAIGLERVVRWAKAISILRHKMLTSTEETDLPILSVSGCLIRGLYIFPVLGTGFIAFLVINYEQYMDSLPWHLGFVVAIMGFPATMLVGLGLFLGLAWGFGVVALSLLKLEAGTRARSSGILGFLLLLLGFTLQFAGTLGQGLTK
jgi:hypothetical protein